MRFKWIRGVTAVAIAVAALSLAAPASATPWGPVAQGNKDQASLITQFLEWVEATWAAVSAPEEEMPDPDALRFQCSGPALDRGCAIDPNG